MLHDELRPFRPGRDGTWDFDAAAHLFRRAAFGAPDSILRAALRRSPDAAVRTLVDGPASDPEIDDLESILDAVLGGGDADAMRAWLIARMVRGAHPLREMMALFWHGHFATSIAKVRDVEWMTNQYRLFLEHGLGRFPVLLDAVARDPAMIRWLDNETNSKGRPNENFARELFELFTLGVGNYTERDIQEAGRAFTGWHLLHGRFHFSAMQHDDGEKTILGRTGRLGGEEVLALALEQEACGRFLAAKLLAFLVTPEPDPAVVASLGAEMRSNGYDLGATLKLLLGSRLFFSERARRSMVKSPIGYLVGTARVFRARLDAGAAVQPLREMGQDLLAPPNVKGWPGHRHWINTASWLARVNAAAWLAETCDPARRGGRDAVEESSRTLLGRPVPETERIKLAESGLGAVPMLRALLSLPEVHVA